MIPRVPTEHLCFAYDLVEALRPRLVVDVGTGAGAALSMLCQSMRDHDVDGSAYGIDTWADEDAKDEEDPTRWSELNGFLRTYLRGVSYLLKMAPADGLQHFATGSIDILRIDAVRAGTPLAALAEAWMERIAPGGVLICTGVNDEARPDLREDWLQVAAQGRGFLFPHGKGLGALRRPSAAESSVVPELLALLTSPDATDQRDLARFYEHADRHFAIRAEIHSKSDQLRRKK